jgi:hypothetical protein
MIFQHHTALITLAVAVYGRGDISLSTTISLQCGRAVRGKQYRNVGLSAIGMNKNADAETSPVPG